MASRALLLGPLECTLQGDEPAGDDVEFVVAERLQQGADGPLARDRPVSNALRPSGVICSRTRQLSCSSPSLRTIRWAARRVIKTDTRLFGSPVSRASSLTVIPGCSQISRTAASDGPYPGNGNCWPAASRTCWRRKPRTTSLSSSATWLCASWRPEAASPAAAARIIVSPGTFTPQPCRRLSQTRRDRRPRDTGPWFAAGITLFGHALSGAAEPGITRLFAAFLAGAVPGLPQAWVTDHQHRVQDHLPAHSGRERYPERKVVHRHPFGISAHDQDLAPGPACREAVCGVA